jgi:hypothetical protein
MHWRRSETGLPSQWQASSAKDSSGNAQSAARSAIAAMEKRIEFSL